MSFAVNKVFEIKANPFRREPVDMRILEAVESICPFKPVTFVDYKELPARNGRRRFQINTAFGVRDK